MNFYKHHIGDYDSHTSHLTWLEDTAYSRLMRLYYRTETPPPPDIKAVCRLVRATGKGERDAVEAVLKEFFTLEEDGWHNARCDAEIAKASMQAETNRQIAEAREAKKRARIDHESLNESLNESSTLNCGEREPSQTPDSRRQTKTPPSPRKRGGEPDGFAEFYAAYPRHVGRPVAARAFQSAGLTSADLPALLAAIEAQRQSPQWTKDNGEFIPHPSTWLNRKGWLDEAPTTVVPLRRLAF